ncbi:MAG: nuclear transport factor 2 family protein [Candidatus Competibacteraceae bacterium]|jgi:ketosteroid isomerase-like protein|nr:nuclear transport factor 2 family protein [Candidatus Competibacteraceae bacterium]
MGTAENKKLVIDALTGGGNSLLDALAEDIRWTLIGTTMYSGTYVGKDEVVQKLVTPLFAQLGTGFQVQIQRAIAEDDHVVVQFQGRARTKTGVPYDNTYCIVMRVEDGKIAEITEYFDTELTTAVLGR